MSIRLANVSIIDTSEGKSVPEDDVVIISWIFLTISNSSRSGRSDGFASELQIFHFAGVKYLLRYAFQQRLATVNGLYL